MGTTFLPQGLVMKRSFRKCVRKPGFKGMNNMKCLNEPAFVWAFQTFLKWELPKHEWIALLVLVPKEVGRSEPCDRRSGWSQRSTRRLLSRNPRVHPVGSVRCKPKTSFFPICRILRVHSTLENWSFYSCPVYEQWRLSFRCKSKPQCRVLKIRLLSMFAYFWCMMHFKAS